MSKLSMKTMKSINYQKFYDKYVSDESYRHDLQSEHTAVDEFRISYDK